MRKLKFLLIPLTISACTYNSLEEKVEIEVDCNEVSFETDIAPIIENNCAISGCHGGNISPDLRNFSTIQARANRIKIRTQNRTMPRGRSLTQMEIDQIACWVDGGALDN